MGFCPQLGGVGPCPAQCIWQGSGFAADQTNAMLAVGGTRCISLISVAAADENSLTPLHRLLPAETASLGFGGSPVGGGDKTPALHFRHFRVGVSLTLRLLWLCRNNPARGLFQQKKRLSQSGCSAPTDALFPPSHSAFSAFLQGGGITTLGARFMLLKRWAPAGHGGVFAVFVPPQCSPCVGEAALVGYTRHPIPQTRTQRLTRRNTAGSQGRW